MAIRAPLVDLPLERDEGEYAYIAWRLGFGELPYRDWFDQKPPVVFWFYRAAFALAEAPAAVRWLGAAVSGATAVAVFALARSFLPWAGAAAAGAAFAVFAADPMLQGAAVNTETLMLLPTVLAHWLFVGCVGATGPRPGRAAAVGVAVAAALVCKPVAAVNAAFFAVAFPWLARGPGRFARWLSFVGWSALAGGLALAAVALAFAAAGAFDDLLYAVFLHNFEYVGALALDERAARLASTVARLAPSQAVLWLVGLLAPLWLAVAGDRRTAGYTAGWLVASAVGAAAGGHAFPHYFQQLLPPLALGLGAVFARVDAAGAARPARATARRAVVLALLLGAPLATLASFWMPPAGSAPAIRRIHPGNYFDAMPEVAAAVARLSAPEDEVFVFGSEPELLFLARRRSASRYIFLFPVYGPFQGAAAAQHEIASEIRASRPAVIVYLPNAMFFAPGNEQFLTRWLLSYLRRSYEPRHVASIDPIGTARLRPAGPETSPATLRSGDYAIVYTRREGAP